MQRRGTRPQNPILHTAHLRVAAELGGGERAEAPSPWNNTLAINPLHTVHLRVTPTLWLASDVNAQPRLNQNPDPIPSHSLPAERC